MRKRSEKKVAPSGAGVRAKILAAETQLNDTFVNREDVVRVMIVAHLVRQHYLLVGTPGTAKTAIATAFVQHIEEASYFKTMLGSFSSPDKVFGALDIQKFQAGIYEHVIDGKLADVHFAFLDEFFKANEATLNELLTTLNEREFMGAKIPLQTCGMATNWPEVLTRTDNTNALYDRCLLRVVVEDVTAAKDMVRVLEAIDAVQSYTPTAQAKFTLTELEVAQLEVKAVTITKEVRKVMADLRTKLAFRKVGNQTKPAVEITSRRLGALQDVLRASAWLDGRDEVTIDDFDLLLFGLWNDRPDIEHAKAMLETLDYDLVSDLISKIDRARDEYRRLSDSDYGTHRVTEVTELFADTVSKVRAAVAKPVFTKQGKVKIHKAMGKMVTDFKEMNRKEVAFVEKVQNGEGV